MILFSLYQIKGAFCIITTSNSLVRSPHIDWDSLLVSERDSLFNIISKTLFFKLTQYNFYILSEYGKTRTRKIFIQISFLEIFKNLKMEFYLH